MTLAKRKSRYRLRAACLRDAPALSYKRAMAETTYFPRRLILAGAMISGVLLALAVHMLGARYGLDLGGLWRSDVREFMPAGAAIAWWLIATVGFSGGYFTANLMDSAGGAGPAPPPPPRRRARSPPSPASSPALRRWASAP
jgi:hypothetical protein